MRIYSDLDNVLINPIIVDDVVVRIEIRPEVGWFLSRLARHGELWLLTHASRIYAMNALRRIGAASQNFSGFLSWEDLQHVEEQVAVIKEANVDEEEKAKLWGLIQPIAPPGVVFDDFPVGSLMYAIKASAVGIGPEKWIQVDSFDVKHPDRRGLRKAYGEFQRRLAVNPVEMKGLKGESICSQPLRGGTR